MEETRTQTFELRAILRQLNELKRPPMDDISTIPSTNSVGLSVDRHPVTPPPVSVVHSDLPTPQTSGRRQPAPMEEDSTESRHQPQPIRYEAVQDDLQFVPSDYAPFRFPRIRKSPTDGPIVKANLKLQ